jgi:subtilase family serine protease
MAATHRSITALAVLMVAMFLPCGCDSPGEPFAYRDLKTSIGPATSPVQPVDGQSTTVTFTLRNTWNQALTGVAWEVRANSDPLVPTSGSVVASGTADIAAFGSSAQNVALGALAKGSHTFAVLVDPANAVAEENESNNAAQVTVLVADQDVAFGTPAPAVAWPTSANTTDQATLTFTIASTVDAAQTSPSPVSVPFAITRNGDPLTVTAVPSSPASVAPNGTTTVTVTVPATGSAGTFVYTVTLSPASGDDRVTTNNSASITVTIPASG